LGSPPKVIVIAGPNGAGKSTAATHLLPVGMTYVNADEVAKTLPNYPSRGADLEAGRIVLEQLEDLELRRASFAVETTLAGRTLAPRIARLRQAGYRFRLIFLWSPSADLSVQRVASRVRAGGHDIPEATIRRRYEPGLRNFFSLYRPIADKWAVYDTARGGPPAIIAEGIIGGEVRIDDAAIWLRVQEGGTDE